MNKFKKILLGAVSVLTLGLFVVTGTKVNATAITETFNATVTDFVGVAVGAEKIVSITGNKGSNLDVTFTNVASKSTTESGSGRCYVKYNNTDDSVSFKFTNTKGNITITLGFRTGSSKTGWIGSLDNATAKALKGTSSETFTSTAIGSHELLLENNDSSKDFQIETFKIEETYETSTTMHNVFYHDINGYVIDDLTQDVEENSNTTAPKSSSDAPSVIGKTFDSWRIGSATGTAVGETINMGTEDINLYATYTTEEGYTVTNPNVLDQNMLQYAKTKFSSKLTGPRDFGDSIFGAQTNNSFGSSKITIAGKEFEYYVLTGGSINATGNGFVVDVPASGYLVMYLRSGSKDKRTISLYPMDSATASITVGDLVASDNYSTDRMIVKVDNSGKYRIGTGGNLYIYEVEFTTEQPISTPVLEQQETSDGSAVRYIATVSNVSDIDDIASWTATMTLGKQTKVLADQTAVYTAVGGANGKSAAENTYYLVVTLKNIPASFNTKQISCEFVVTLKNGQVIGSNTLYYTINVTA